ncbi:MAG: hypothetical protein FWC38_04845 [Proteobacteria bacterium]|nr:hypothetical protein [Pseudomonadota bacterium]
MSSDPKSGASRRCGAHYNRWGRGQRSEVRGQRSEVRGQRSGIRDQGSGIRDQKNMISREGAKKRKAPF